MNHQPGSYSRLVSDGLAIVEQFDDAVGAFVSVDRDAALKCASACDDRAARGETQGRLHGMPIAVKDSIDAKGRITGAGAKFLRENIAGSDAPALRGTLEAGAVLVGKTNMHELAYGMTSQNEHYRDSRNPWDLRRIPGGSSGGSAAAVAAGMVPVALGTDTGGSVRSPAALCGVTGIRPTQGAVSNKGVYPLSRRFDAVGVMAYSAELVGSVLQAMIPEFTHQHQAIHSARRLRGIAGIKLGVLGGHFTEELHPDVDRAVQQAVLHLKDLGARIEPVELPGAAEAQPYFSRSIATEMFAAHGERMETDPSAFNAGVRQRIMEGSYVSARELADAIAFHDDWLSQCDELFTQADVMACATVGVPAPLVEEVLEGSEARFELSRAFSRNTVAWSFAGVPALSIPCGFTPDGLPIGLQLIGPRWSDLMLLDIARHYQATTDWHTRRPSLGSTSKTESSRPEKFGEKGEHS